MRRLLIAAVVCGGLALPSVAMAQHHNREDNRRVEAQHRDNQRHDDRRDDRRVNNQRHDNWNWRQRNTATFRNLGQCQRALVAERNLARRDARSHGWNDNRFNQGWRLRCDQTRVRGRVVYRIR